MVPTKELTPYVPITVDEIINTAVECADLGVRIIHIHPRDKDGNPTWEKEVFKQIIGGIRNKTDKLLISTTTSGRLWSDFERRSSCLDLTGDFKPELASLTVGSNNFIKVASVNSPSMIHQLATKMLDRGIKPELEVFGPGMLHKANVLIEKKVVSNNNPYFNFLLGSLGTSPLHPATFGAMHALLPPNAVWSLAGIGQFQLSANMTGLAFGGHVRVGLEDNIFWNRETKKLATNQSLVTRLLEIIKLMELEIATPGETKKMLGIEQ